MSTDILERFLEADLDPAGYTDVELDCPKPSSQAADSRREHSGRIRVALALASVVGLLLIGSALLSVEGEESGSEGLGALMTASANAAEAGSGRSIEYTRSTVTSSALIANGRPFTTYARTRFETWIAPDGSARLRVVDLPDRWPGPRDKRRGKNADFSLAGFKAPPQVEFDEELGASFIELELSQDDLPFTSQLPTDPGELMLAFQAEYTSNPSIERDRRIFQLASQVVLLPTATPDLRAASYEVMAGLDSVIVKSGVMDPKGRIATAASITNKSGVTSTLFFDPATSQALAQTDAGGGPSDFVDNPLIGSFVVDEVAQVGSLNDR